MLGAVIRALIYLCVLAICFFLVMWVLSEIIMLPAIIVHLIWVIFVLIALLVLWQLFSPWLAGVDWWGRPPPPP